jgi:hypothetical protein
MSLNHGINSTVFAYPASTGLANATVVNVVSKYYNLARTSDTPLASCIVTGIKRRTIVCPLTIKVP